jgi:uncharacterized protein YndB with AHSA1/START domain
MSSWRRQALIDAPVGTVWELVGDPNRHPEWFPMVLEVSGLGAIEENATYRQVSRGVGGKMETTFAIEEIEDMRRIAMRCTDTGTYTRWWLTEARGATFADIEMGFEPNSLLVRVVDVTVGKRYCRRWTEQALDGLDAAIAQERARHPTPGADS